MIEGTARLKVCENLRHPPARWVRRIANNGSEQLCYWCSTCQRAVTRDSYESKGQYVSAVWLKETLGIDAKDLPQVRLDLTYQLCFRCGKTRLCEMHHTAPQAAFPDADEWPIVPLCVEECHPRYTRTLEAWVQLRIQNAVASQRSSQAPPKRAA